MVARQPPLEAVELAKAAEVAVAQVVLEAAVGVALAVLAAITKEVVAAGFVAVVVVANG